MKVEQNFVTIGRYMVNSQGRTVLVRNCVVSQHQLRSHMLLTLMRKLDQVISRDRDQLFQLAEVYLPQSGPLHSYYSWQSALEEHLTAAATEAQIDEGMDVPEDCRDRHDAYSRLLNLRNLLQLRRPY